MVGTHKRAKPRVNWREVVWWSALVVLMGAILALATWVHAE